MKAGGYGSRNVHNNLEINTIFFAPQERQYALSKLKFGVKERSRGALFHTIFTPISEGGGHGSRLPSPHILNSKFCSL